MNARALDLKEVASQISAIWVQMQQQFRTLPFGAKLIFSVAIGGLMLRALGVGFDTSTLILIALALSPWVGVIIEKMKFGEFEVNLKERQEQQQSQIDTAIRFLVKTAVSDYELRHLQGLLQNGTFAVELHDNFQRELRHLLELGLIQRKPGKGFRSLYASPAPHNVKDHFESRTPAADFSRCGTLCSPRKSVSANTGSHRSSDGHDDTALQAPRPASAAEPTCARKRLRWSAVRQAKDQAVFQLANGPTSGFSCAPAAPASSPRPKAVL